jgi:hypothetical protein
MDRFDSLPLPLLQRVLAFADGDYVVDVLPRAPQLPTELFATLGKVSRGFHVLVQQLTEIHAATTLAVHVAHGRDQELRDMHANIRLRGPTLCALSLRLGTNEFIRSFEIFKAREDEQRIDTHVHIDWEQVFAQCPKLQRLDLSGVPLHSEHLKRILNAASKQCHDIKALIMPKREWHRGPVTSEWLPTMHVLYRAMERWHSYNGSGGTRGLQQLSVPQRITRSSGDVTIHELADQYLFAVAAFCPDLEYFDGWKDTYQQVDARLLCEELLYCSKPAWHVFNDRCRKIRELNWYVLPFIDDFFDVFAAFAKPQLKKLTIAGGDHINFNDHAVFGTYYEDGAWSYSAARLNRIFLACPALEELDVTFQLPPFDDGARQDTITDGLLISLARNCPKLRSLVITELFDADFYGSIEGVTDKGICAIAKLPQLEEVRIKATYCEGAGVAAMLLDAPEGAPERTVKLVIGDDVSDGSEPGTTYRAGFYEILAECLGMFVEQSAKLERKRFTLNLQGRHRGRPQVALWRGTSQLLKDQLQTLCPWIHIAITERHRQVSVVLTTSLPKLTPTPLRSSEQQPWPVAVMSTIVRASHSVWSWFVPQTWQMPLDEQKKILPAAQIVA